MTRRTPRGTGDTCPPTRLLVAVGIAFIGWSAIAIGLCYLAFQGVPDAIHAVNHIFRQENETGLMPAPYGQDDGYYYYTDDGGSGMPALAVGILEEVKLVLHAVAWSCGVAAMVVILAGGGTNVHTLLRYRSTVRALYETGRCDRSWGAVRRELEQQASNGGIDAGSRLPETIGAVREEGVDEGEHLDLPEEGVEICCDAMTRKPPFGGTLSRRHPLEPRAAGLLRDTTLETFAFDLANNFVFAYVANIAVGCLFLTVISFVLTFVVAYARTQAILVQLVIAFSSSTLVALLGRFICVRWCLANRERIKHQRWFIAWDTVNTFTIGALSGIGSAIARTILMTMWGVLKGLRVDEPAFPRPLHILDPCWASWAAMIRTKQYAWTHAMELQAKYDDRQHSMSRRNINV